MDAGYVYVLIVLWLRASSAATINDTVGFLHAAKSEVQVSRDAPCNTRYCSLTCSGATYYNGMVIAASVDWKKDGKNVPGSHSSRVYQSPDSNGSYASTTLHFQKAEYSDSGLYNCSGAHRTSSSSSLIIRQISVVIRITGSPKETIIANSTSVPSHNNVFFKCHFNGNPLPRLEWKFRNGSKLPATSQFQIGKMEQSSSFDSSLGLTVFGTDCKDTSLLQYQCFATNSNSTPVESRVFRIDPLNNTTGGLVQQALVTYHPDKCNGFIANISWSVLPGAENLSHGVFVGQNKVLTTPPGQFSAEISNLKPTSQYSIAVLPLFQGCPEVPSSHLNITTSAGHSPPVNVTLKMKINTCVISWRGLTPGVKYVGVSVRYIEVPHKQRNSMYKGKSSITNLSISTYQYTLVAMAPNTRYQVYVGLLPPKPCQGRVNIVWSKNFTGNCITEAKGPTSVPLSNKPPASVAGGVQVSLAPVSERNGLISCYFVIAHKVLNGGSGKVESNITKLRQVNVSAGVKDGDSYIAIAMPRFAQAKDVTIGNSTKSCCDVTDTSGMSKCSVTSSRKRRSVSGSVVQGRNWPLTAGANYTYYIITATPVQSGSGPPVIIYTASPSQLFAVKEVIGPPTGPSDPSSGLVALYVIIVIVILAVIGVVVFLLYRRRQQNHHKTTKNESNDEEVELRSPSSDNSDHVTAKTESERLKHTEAISA